MMEQFKIGDWVQVIAGHERPIGSLFKVKSCLTRYRAADVKLWEPNEGEWCWFYTSESKGRRYINPQLGRFQNFVKQNTNTYKNGYRFVTDVGFYKQCEPFIGELPSFLKEQ